MENTEPEKIVAGDSVEWSKSVGLYPASDGWVLNYAFHGPADIAIGTTAAGDSHVVQISASESATFPPGYYKWASFFTRGDARKTYQTGSIDILADPTASTGGVNQKSYNQQVLDAVNAVILNQASKAQQEMSVEGISIKKRSMQDLLMLQDRFNLLVAEEKRALDNLNTGRKSGNNILAVFTDN